MKLLLVLPGLLPNQGSHLREKGGSRVNSSWFVHLWPNSKFDRKIAPYALSFILLVFSEDLGV